MSLIHPVLMDNSIALLGVFSLLTVSLAGHVFLRFRSHKSVPFDVVMPEEALPGWKGGSILSNPCLQDSTQPGQIICYDPSTGRHLATIRAHTKTDVDLALDKARKAQAKWRNTTFAQRKIVLQSLLDFILLHQESICRVASRDTGKTMVDGKFGEILTVCERIRWTLAHGEKALRDEYRDPGLLMFYKAAKVEYRPMGVVAALVSWNYPFHNTFGPLITAIFAGNGILIKASEQVAWSTTVYFAKIARTCLEACGHDPELVQFLVGFQDCGEAVVASGVDGITFIGSPHVGTKVATAAAANLTPCVLELGGKDVAIINKDVNLNALVPILMRGVFQNCGQNCIGIERIIVHKDLHDKLVDMAGSRIKQLKQGPPLEIENIDCGAMTMSGRAEVLEPLIEDAVNKGATLICGGKGFIHPHFPQGQFFTPTLITNLRPNMRIAQEETFAPIMAIFKFSTLEEAISIANSSIYSLGSSVFSRNQKEGLYIMDRLRVGMSNLNDFGVNYLCQSLPFGGVGKSGYGRFGGAEGLRGVCHQRSITVDRWPMLIQTSLPPILQYPMNNVGDAIVVTRDLVNIIYAGWLERIKSVFDIVKVLLLGSNEPEQL
ncbi:Meiotic Sister-Chromatid recombination aldehyde dehydrogenase [Lobosporangium transversale]|uniref:Aldehyde/histidinol dehydrogenase n=1 Tax=Lobosporangium transversale TaxID=64571 RepID=A0A1Y2GZA9_9FUNG|nr:Aldehyde/histidinol dehydrogenase [Lobosporangium transversale]KAF9904052.1 Meiotic Sister-Chromatid recombination aldehyde dehydrogenase [Lobosporangium transversale]ORZ24926.1 Aldehyde/histidinol dehydrogenase [Lobosporangium transversale]|eukprot:XP_021883907.1 Aldehyde/histidinol dehydrogenase [Lobosporangium transversale]